jgi:hypothetical protein
LSRLAQRCGARNAADLVLAADELLEVFTGTGIADPASIPQDYRLPFTLSHRDTSGIAVLAPCKCGGGDTAVVKTILDPDMT